ncbi:hypothetical protein [Lacrimispora sp.]|uniref:hypothetical protein n=1 Tax=Lacrimispora sp. TaxID=2719234 RepID=UPI0028988CEE|nr:hypothetical protein [Lacrimispora sp.]
MYIEDYFFKERSLYHGQIKLKDGTIIEIEGSCNGNSFQMRFSDPLEYLTTLAMLNLDNLSVYQVQINKGLVCDGKVCDPDVDQEIRTF